MHQLFPMLHIIFAVDLNWSKITTPIYELFMGSETNNALGILGGDMALLGMFIFLILFVLTLIFGLGMLVGTVVIIPATFAVFNFVPELRIIVAIICGLLFGIGLNKLIRR